MAESPTRRRGVGFLVVVIEVVAVAVFALVGNLLTAALPSGWRWLHDWPVLAVATLILVGLTLAVAWARERSAASEGREGAAPAGREDRLPAAGYVPPPGGVWHVPRPPARSTPSR